MSIWEALILGIIQGLTEFLPVSSSGHLELAKVIFGVETQENLLLSLVLHLGTALSTIVIFRKYIAEVLGGLIKKPMNDSWDFGIKVVVSMLPALVVGLVFKDQIDQLFDGSILLVSIMLLITGVLLTLTWSVRNREGSDISFLRAIIMGIAQAIAILPGISRSGATIATGILSGASKEKATQFSFLMVLPVIIGASILELKDYFEAPAGSQSIGMGVLIVGFLASFLVGMAACQWMVGIVRKGKLIYFAFYCFIVGAIALATTLF